MKSKKELRHLQRIRERAKTSAHKFSNEVKKAVNTAILAAFGLILALVWKDVITEYVDRIAKESPLQGKIISALIVTVICVGGMLIIARLTRVDEEAKE